MHTSVASRLLPMQQSPSEHNTQTHHKQQCGRGTASTADFEVLGIISQSAFDSTATAYMRRMKGIKSPIYKKGYLQQSLRSVLTHTHMPSKHRWPCNMALQWCNVDGSFPTWCWNTCECGLVLSWNGHNALMYKNELSCPSLAPPSCMCCATPIYPPCCNFYHFISAVNNAATTNCIMQT